MQYSHPSKLFHSFLWSSSDPLPQDLSFKKTPLYFTSSFSHHEDTAWIACVLSTSRAFVCFIPFFPTQWLLLIQSHFWIVSQIRYLNQKRNERLRLSNRCDTCVTRGLHCLPVVVESSLILTDDRRGTCCTCTRVYWYQFISLVRHQLIHPCRCHVFANANNNSNFAN